MERNAAVALVLATPVAVWCLVGDLSATQFDSLDYLWRAPQLPRTFELLLGIGALVVVVASTVELVGALYRGRVRRQWSATVVPLAVAATTRATTRGPA
ncbi:MAG TPA: hypothetical protein VNT52_17870, partial [Acidimicrobiales bacterium]|nr:hypothetical protein [Acidimicrobiales bacterium]